MIAGPVDLTTAHSTSFGAANGPFRVFGYGLQVCLVRLFQRLSEHFARLGTRYAITFGEHKEGYAVYSQFPSLGLVFADFLSVGVARKYALDLFRFQACINGQPQQRVVIADRFTFGKIPTKESLFHGVLKVMTSCQVQQAMSVECIARSNDLKVHV